MVRNTFFEDSVFTSMSDAQKQELRRALKKVAAFEESTGQSFESGFSREQYANLFDSMKIRHVENFFHLRSSLMKYVQYLIDNEVLTPEHRSILESISIDDLSTVYYFKNINMLYEALKDTIDSSECYDPAVFDPPAVAIFLAWYGLTREEIADYRKEDVLDDGIMIKGEKITPPFHILQFFTSMRDSEGYYQQAKGVIFHAFLASEYLIRSKRKSHVSAADIANQVARVNKIMDGMYSLELSMIRQSGIFFRAYQLECESTKFDLNDPEFASRVFCEDFTSNPKKGRHIQLNRIRDYKFYKQLFS